MPAPAPTVHRLPIAGSPPGRCAGGTRGPTSGCPRLVGGGWAVLLAALSIALGALPAVAQPPPPPAETEPDPEATPLPPPTDEGDVSPDAEPEQATPPPEAPAPPAPAAELPEPSVVPTTEPDGEEIDLSDWDSDDWLLVKPRLSLLDLDGYFRFRGDMLKNMDFGNRSTRFPARNGGGEDARPDARDSEFTYANMRLRIEPTINVSENIHIVTTLDILDNVILGSTPDSIPLTGDVAHNFRARSQTPPSDGFNAVVDSLRIKRAYALVTALNEQLELRIGRMPNHFGLGMMTNSGDCLDCDEGDTVDRIALSFKAADHVFTPMFDWVSNGPIYVANRSGGQPLDPADWDDIEQYSVRATHIDHPDDIKDALANDEWVLNYGAWVIWRRQTRDLGASYYAPDPAGGFPDGRFPDGDIVLDGCGVDAEDGGRCDEERRDANMVTTDIFAQFWWKTFSAGLEAAFIWGEFNDRVIASPEEESLGAPDRTTQMLMWGFALELAYRLEGDYDGVEIQLRGGAASGDSAPGFGSLDEEDSQRGFFGGAADADQDLNNFQFSPNYHIDLLMYRQILGTVTDSWYISPGVSYDFDERININGHVTYTQAMFKRSTPSCGTADVVLCGADDVNGAREMGVEIDAQASYGLLHDEAGNAFRAALQGGILFPLGAFNNPTRLEEDQGPDFAWTIQGRMYITF